MWWIYRVNTGSEQQAVTTQVPVLTHQRKQQTTCNQYKSLWIPVHRERLDPVPAPLLKPPGPPISSPSDHCWKQREGEQIGRARFCQDFSNYHGQISAISPVAAYSPQTLALAVTACASASTQLLYSIHFLQLHLHIVHWNKNCSNCAFLYNCTVLDPPPRETVTQHTSLGSMRQNFQVPSGSM